MTPTETKVQELLATSDLPRRLADARKHPDVDELWRYAPERPSLLVSAIALVLVGGLAVGPLVGLARTPEEPVGVTVFLLAMSAAMTALTIGTCRRIWTLRGEVRRELFAVIDRDRLQLGRARSFYVTLWNPETAPFRTQLLRGEPECGIGDVGVAYFRGKHLVDLIKVPVEWAPTPGR